MRRTSRSRAVGSPQPTPRMRWKRRALLCAALATLAVVVPAALLLRAPLALMDAHGWNAWLAIGAGVALCSALVAGVGAWGWWRLLGSRPHRAFIAALLAIVPVFAAVSLFHLPGRHAKTESVHAAWSELQPVLRLGVGVLRFGDEWLVLTDVTRTRAAYREMGLATRRRSAHYVQADGWVHAVDLRTRDRGFIRNALVRAYFELLGFETLRHAGTADHLHVSLPSLRGPDRL